MVMIVIPTSKEYPKCRDGMAAHWLQNLLAVQTDTAPSAPWTVSVKPKLLAIVPMSPSTVSSLSNLGGIHGHRVKTIKAIKLQTAIVRLLAS